MSLLEIRNLTKHFGGVLALNEVSFKIEEKQTMGLIGPNGAGKTTLFNVISGIIRNDKGQILFRGRRIDGLHPHEMCSLGITRTFQLSRVYQDMTVLEHVLLAYHPMIKSGFLSAWLGTRRAKKEEILARDKAFEVLKICGLNEDANKLAVDLSAPEQRALELAQALTAEPKLIMLDEPAAGLSAQERKTLVELILNIRKQGKTILLVEHDMGVVMPVSDEIIVLSFGKLIAQGPPNQIQQDINVIEAYLGED